MRSVVRMAVLGLALVGCGRHLFGVDAERLAEARMEWEANAPDVYQIWYEGEYEGTERSELVTVDRENQSLDNDDPFAVDQLFVILAERLESGAALNARFDLEHGYPTEVESEGIDLEAKAFRGARRVDGCAGVEPGGPLDVSVEPFERVINAELYGRWTDESGCPVRTDVLTTIAGDPHCAWESIEYVIVGGPLGDGEERWFIRDPRHRLGDFDTVERSEVGEVMLLPPAVADTGYRQGDRELWIAPGDVDLAYVVTGTLAFEYVRDREFAIVCS